MSKFAVVTGGSRGIGKAIAIALAEEGYSIIINYNSNHTEAKQTQKLIEDKGQTCILLPFNVADQDQTEKTLGAWIENNPTHTIEILINNAGIRKDNLMLLMEPGDWHSVIQTNLNGFYNVTRLLLKGMIFNKFGRIINIVSLSGISGLPGQTNYSAAKAAVIGATKALSQEVGRRGITVNAVAPGFIKTDMTEGINEADYKSIIPVGRFGTPEEVAHAVTFLCSKNASYITGETLTISGGLH